MAVMFESIHGEAGKTHSKSYSGKLATIFDLESEEVKVKEIAATLILVLFVVCFVLLDMDLHSYESAAAYSYHIAKTTRMIRETCPQAKRPQEPQLTADSIRCIGRIQRSTEQYWLPSCTSCLG